MDCSFDESDKTLVLDLLHKLRGTASAQPAPAKAAAASDRAGRAKEALAEERAARKKAAANAALLKQELAAESAASATAAAQQAKAAAAPKGSSVRLTLCSADKPSERKAVVVPRSTAMAELFKTAKAKLRLKKVPLGAKLLEGGEVLSDLLEVPDGSVVAVTAEALTAAPEAPPSGGDAAGGAVAMLAAAGEPAAEAGAEAPAPAPAETAEAEGSAAAPEPRRGSNGRERGSGGDGAGGGGGGGGLPRRLEGSEAAAAQQALAAARPPEAMAAQRAALPVAGHKEALLRAIEDSAACVVQGEPGCGEHAGGRSRPLRRPVRARGHGPLASHAGRFFLTARQVDAAAAVPSGGDGGARAGRRGVCGDSAASARLGHLPRAARRGRERRGAGQERRVRGARRAARGQGVPAAVLHHGMAATTAGGEPRRRP